MSDSEYKEGEDRFVSVRLRQDHAVKIDKSDDEEEEDDVYFPPIAIVTLIENFGEKTTNKERAKANEYLADSIRHVNVEGFEIFLKEGIHEYLMTAFQFTPDTQIFSTIIDCIYSWITNLNSPPDSFCNVDFLNAVLFVATSCKKEKTESLTFSQFGIVNNETRNKLMHIFTAILRKNIEIAPNFNRKMILERSSNAFSFLKNEKEKKSIIDFIDNIISCDFGAEITVEEVVPLENIITPLCKTPTETIDSYVNGLLSIITTLYNSNSNVAAFLMDNFEFIEVIKMAANASDHNKQAIIKCFLSLARSPTLDFYDALLSKMNWAYFNEFVVNANISIVKDTIRFILAFVEKFPILLNGAEFEDFVDYELEIFESGAARNKEIAAEFLAFIIQCDNQKVFEHLMDKEFLFNCGDLLENKDQHLILTLLKGITYAADRLKKTNAEVLPDYIEELNNNDVIEAISDIADSENDEISSIASDFMKNYCNDDDDGD